MIWLFGNTCQFIFFHSFSYLFIEIFIKHPVYVRSWVHMVNKTVIIPAFMEVIEERMNM